MVDTLCTLDELTRDPWYPMHRAPTTEEVERRAGELAEQGMDQNLIAVENSDGGIVVLGGRLDLAALCRIDADNAWPLPGGICRECIPVSVHDPTGALVAVVRGNTRNRARTAAEHVRAVQYLKAWSDPKEFVSRAEIGRYGGQPAGPQHQPGWPTVIAQVSRISRERARQIVRLADGLDEERVSAALGTEWDSYAALSRLVQASADAQATGQTGGGQADRRRPAGSNDVRDLDPGEEAQRVVRAWDVDQLAAFFGWVKAEVDRNTYEKLLRRFSGQRNKNKGHRGPGRTGSRASYAEIEAVKQRLDYLQNRSTLDVNLVDVARMAGLGPATVTEVAHMQNRVGKISDTIHRIDQVLNKLKVPEDPVHPRAGEDDRPPRRNGTAPRVHA